MKKLTAMLALAAALTLTACSAPAASNPEAPPASAASTTPTITAAPIQPQAAAEPAPTTVNPGEDYGDMTQDEFYLEGVHWGWRGPRPSDEQLIAAGLLVCEELEAGKKHDDIRVVLGDTDDAAWNNEKVVMMGGQVYCYDIGFIGPA